MLDRERITEEEIPLGLPDKLKLRGKDPDLFHSEENLLDTAAMFFTHVYLPPLFIMGHYGWILKWFLSIISQYCAARLNKIS